MSDLTTLYQGIILDHSRTPEHTGDTAAWPRRSHQVNPTCGDEVTLAVRVEDGRIADVLWQGHGCAVSQASASLMSGLVAGKAVDDVRSLASEFREVLHSRGRLELDEERFEDAVALNGVSRYLGRIKCAMLGWVALEAALDLEPDGGVR